LLWKNFWILGDKLKSRFEVKDVVRIWMKRDVEVDEE
jgi:hypothetical protein